MWHKLIFYSITDQIHGIKIGYTEETTGYLLVDGRT